MLNIRRKNEKEKIIIYNNIRTSMSNYSDESITNTINLKMRKINKKRNVHNNSNTDKIRKELKKLLGDLQGSKFNTKTQDKISKELKLNKLKLTPYQKMLKANEKTKKALSIKKHLLLNPKNLQYILKLNNINNNFNKTERSLHSYNKSPLFELNKTQNNHSKKSYINICVKTIKLPISRNIKSYKDDKNYNNFEFFKTDQNSIKNDNNKQLIMQRNNRHSLLLMNSKQPTNYDIINNKRRKLNINNIFDKKNYSKTYSNMNLNISSIRKRENKLPINKYIDTHNTEAYKTMIKPLNLISNNINNKYLLTNNEKSKKIIINNKNNNRTYNSFLLNKTLYNNGNFVNKKI